MTKYNHLKRTFLMLRMAEQLPKEWEIDYEDL